MTTTRPRLFASLATLATLATPTSLSGCGPNGEPLDAAVTPELDATFDARALPDASADVALDVPLPPSPDAAT